jgi:hypothetical protein
LASVFIMCTSSHTSIRYLPQRRNGKISIVASNLQQFSCSHLLPLIRRDIEIIDRSSVITRPLQRPLIIITLLPNGMPQHRSRERPCAVDCTSVVRAGFARPRAMTVVPSNTAVEQTASVS